MQSLSLQSMVWRPCTLVLPASAVLSPLGRWKNLEQERATCWPHTLTLSPSLGQMRKEVVSSEHCNLTGALGLDMYLCVHVWGVGGHYIIISRFQGYKRVINSPFRCNFVSCMTLIRYTRLVRARRDHIKHTSWDILVFYAMYKATRHRACACLYYMLCL